MQIAAVVLLSLLAIVGFWWGSRPNLDPRFVGEWEYYAVKDFAPDDAYSEPDPEVLKLSSDGTANGRHFERLGFTLVDWWVDQHGHFVLVSRYDGKRSLRWEIESSYSRLTNEFHNAHLDRWMIDQVADGRITMRRFGDPNAHLMLKRVSLAKVVR
jgi:hypothetical protein